MKIVKRIILFANYKTETKRQSGAEPAKRVWSITRIPAVENEEKKEL